MNKFLKRVIKQIKSFPKNLFYLFGGSPAIYWGWLMFVFGLIFSSAVISGVYFFISTNEIISAEIVLPKERRQLTIDRGGLAQAAKIIETREGEYNNVLITPLKPDPSF